MSNLTKSCPKWGHLLVEIKILLKLLAHLIVVFMSGCGLNIAVAQESGSPACDACKSLVEEWGVFPEDRPVACGRPACVSRAPQRR